MSTTSLNSLEKISKNFPSTPKMPVLFVGHGNPMNAIEENIFSKKWEEIAIQLPKPNAIVCISAHWETKGTKVTYSENPRTIHDFGGFPKELFDVQYPALGSKIIAEETKNIIHTTSVELDQSWGLDHGCWSVLINMYPKADVPVIQLSLDYTQPAIYHFELAKQLQSLRTKGVLILGSGNMVHNLGTIAVPGGNFNEPFAWDWAQEANTLFKEYILENRSKELVNYKKLGSSVQLSIPTPEHYLPMLYTLALRDKKDEINFFNDVIVGGSAGMTSFIF